MEGKHGPASAGADAGDPEALSRDGTGQEGFFLVPAPADLAWLAGAPKDKADPYIFWSVAEGGKAFESEMPAFKRSMSRQDIWSLAAYLRAGMPYASP